MRRLAFLATSVALALGATLMAPAQAGPAGLSDRVIGCSAQAAQYHGVNADVLRAILLVESGGKPLAVNRNSNGTLDVGIAQINSIHFKELKKYGIRPDHLFDECIATFVAAWHYAKQVKLYGNTWRAIGAYHSRTPSHNEKYQRLVYRQLLRMGVYRATPSSPSAAEVVAQSSGQEAPTTP